MNGNIENSQFSKDSIFNLNIPIAIDGIPSEVLNPRNSWENKAVYDAKASELADAFQQNFNNYGDSVLYLKEFGPK